MGAFVALFRGINVGGRNKLPMKVLAAMMADLGLNDVATYIQSGNVAFRAEGIDESRLIRKLQSAIQDQFGFSPQILVVTGSEIDQAIADNPFPEAEAEPKSLHVTFLQNHPEDPDLDELERIGKPGERFVLSGKLFYLHAPDGIGQSRLAGRIEKSLGVAGTSRNWRTVLRLRAMIQAFR